MSEQTPETILRVEDSKGNSADIRAKHLGEWEAKGYYIPRKKPPAPTDTGETTSEQSAGKQSAGEQSAGEQTQDGDSDATDLD